MHDRTAMLIVCLVATATDLSVGVQPVAAVPEDSQVQMFSTPTVCGYVDASGRILVPAHGECDHLCRFQEGLAAVRTVNRDEDSRGPGRWGFVDQAGRLVIPDRFQYAADFREGLAAVNVGGEPNHLWDPIPGVSLLDESGRHHVIPVVGGAWGFIDRRGEFVINPTYVYAASFSEGLALVKDSQGWGYIDKSGKLVIRLPKNGRKHIPELHSARGSDPFEPVDSAPPLVSSDSLYGRSFSEGLAAYGGEGLYGYLDRTGREVIPRRFSAVSDFSCGLACVQLDKRGKWGFVDKTGAVVIEPRFEKRASFQAGLAGVKIGGKFGFIDDRGEMVIAPRYDMTHGFRDDLAPVLVQGKWGYIDRNGGTVIAPRFVGAGLFRNGIARVATEGRDGDGEFVSLGSWGFIDKSGRFLVPPVYDQALDFWEGKAFVGRFPRYGLKDAAGNVLLEPMYEFFNGPQEGLMCIKKQMGDKVGYVDWHTGKIMIPMTFDWAEPFSCGRAAVCQGDKWGVIDRSGRFVVEPHYARIGSYEGGLAAVDVDLSGKLDGRRGKYGFIDTSGKFVIAPQFDCANSFSEGLAAVEAVLPKRAEDTDHDTSLLDRDSRWGFIDTTGKVVIAPQFLSVHWFQEGLAAVEILAPARITGSDGKAELAGYDDLSWGFIDKTGKIVIEPQFQDADSFHEGLAAVQTRDAAKWGFIDKTGKIAIHPQFDRVAWFQNGRATVWIGKQEYEVDRQGHIQAIPRSKPDNP